MKVMKAKVAVIATLLVAGLVGCGKQRPPDAQVAPAADADGTWCGANAKGPVYINIIYAQDGMPSADPDQCTVDPGAEVTWRGPDGNPTSFAIKFKDVSPVDQDERLGLASDELDKQHKVKKKMSVKAGTYAYGIQANGKEKDPAIIIR